MDPVRYQIIGNKVILRVRDHLCDSADEVLRSSLFREVVGRVLAELAERGSRLLGIFEHQPNLDADVDLLVETTQTLLKLPPEKVIRVVPESAQFFQDRALFNEFVEYVYNYWRSMQRLIVCDSAGDAFDRRPYRTFNQTVEQLTHLVRRTYRDVQESITGAHPRIYRQVRAGAEIATIALARETADPNPITQGLSAIPIIRQVLIYPPLIFTPPMNKRKGSFERVDRNPLEGLELDPHDWLCYPARVGPLVVMVYFNLRFFELGFSLCNLFDLADEADLERQPDAVYLFGVPNRDFHSPGKTDTIFFEDAESGMLVAAIPDRDEFAYFGYLKKMILTLHNIQMMKRGRLPYHGAMVNLKVRGAQPVTLLMVGDTGAGKSETLEAFRQIAEGEIQDITIIADDMGSLELREDGAVIGYGTETGAFVRLDDLQPGYAFGQIDRTIIMSPNQSNARVVLPVTTYENITRGFAVDYVLYANNYEAVDANHPTVERFHNIEDALSVFRAGAVMSKGTTATTGIVSTYFANIFGPEQYPELHDRLAIETFDALFQRGIFVGQLRTQLGIDGMEQQGPGIAARALLDLFASKR